MHVNLLGQLHQRVLAPQGRQGTLASNCGEWFHLGRLIVLSTGGYPPKGPMTCINYRPIQKSQTGSGSLSKWHIYSQTGNGELLNISIVDVLLSDDKALQRAVLKVRSYMAMNHCPERGLDKYESIIQKLCYPR